MAANPGGEMVGGVLGTLQLVLSPLASPRIAAPTPPAATSRIEEFLASTDTLYLMTEGNADGAAPFVTALVDEIMHQARRASQRRMANGSTRRWRWCWTNRRTPPRCRTCPPTCPTPAAAASP